MQQLEEQLAAAQITVTNLSESRQKHTSDASQHQEVITKQAKTITDLEAFTAPLHCALGEAT